MPMFRCTRPDQYPIGTDGYRDRTARDGHYVIAPSWSKARIAFRQRFPNDLLLDVEEGTPVDTLSRIKLKAKGNAT